jgi:hypothetical protein
MVSIDDYFLPIISVKVDVSPHEFLVRMGEIAEHNSDIKDVQKNHLADKLIQNLSILFKTEKSDGLESLCGMFTTRPRNKERVWVELSSKSWAEYSPTYEEYVYLIVRYLKPLLSMYNKKYNTNRRFRIPSKDSLRSKFSKCTARLFQHFVNYANKTHLSRINWKHFYDFIICCHGRYEYFSYEELEYLLKEAGFNGYYCEKLCSIFEHGWDLLEQLPESQLRARLKQMRKQKIQERDGILNGGE